MDSLSLILQLQNIHQTKCQSSEHIVALLYIPTMSPNVKNTWVKFVAKKVRKYPVAPTKPPIIMVHRCPSRLVNTLDSGPACKYTHTRYNLTKLKIIIVTDLLHKHILSLSCINRVSQKVQCNRRHNKIHS